MKSLVFAVSAAILAGLLGEAPAVANPFGGEAGQAARADRILVKKAERKMYLFAGDQVLATYAIALGRNPEGHKFFAGDGRTPEGLYYIEYKNERSRFYRSLKISYPSVEDRQTSREYRLPAGGAIMIHGQPTDPLTGRVEAREADWTEGCIAVANSEMDEIWSVVEPGTPIEIQP